MPSIREVFPMSCATCRRDRRDRMYAVCAMDVEDWVKICQNIQMLTEYTRKEGPGLEVEATAAIL